MFKVKSFLLNLLLFCAVSAMILGLAEAALRVAGNAPRGYVTPEVYGNVNLLYRPNSLTRWRGNLGKPWEFDTPVRTNSLAQHDAEHALQKPDDVYRVVVAGDSFVEALQVPLDDGFANLLQANLNRDSDVVRQGRRVEVIKLGSSGNGALKTCEALLRHAFRYDPDLVLFFFTDSNDFDDDWHYFRRQTGLEANTRVNLKPPKKSYDRVEFYRRLLILPNSRLNRWLAFQITQWREKKRNRQEDANRWQELLGVYGIPGSPRFAGEAKKWEEAFRLTAAGVVKMNEAAAAHGSDFGVVFVDRPQVYRPDAYRYLFKLVPGLEKDVDLDLPAKKLKAFLSGRGTAWLDLNPVFQKNYAGGRTGHYVFDGHWNADGHRWTAEALAPWVKQRLLGAAQTSP